MQNKLDSAIKWVKRYFPRHTQFILIAVEPSKVNPQPTISYLSTMPRGMSMEVLASLGEQLLKKDREFAEGVRDAVQRDG